MYPALPGWCIVGVILEHTGDMSDSNGCMNVRKITVSIAHGGHIFLHLGHTVIASSSEKYKEIEGPGISEWQSVDVSVPPDHETVLVWYEDVEMAGMGHAVRVPFGLVVWYCTDKQYKSSIVTHWRSMPSGPTKKQSEE